MKQLSGLELQAMSNAPDGALPLLVDVREPWEFELASIRIEGSRTLHIPMNSIPDRLGELDASQPIVCICHHGARSAQVVAFLERQGFESVYNLAGGIDAWSQRVDAGVPRY
jgi:rhodanese-related sulfurtransferase